MTIYFIINKDVTRPHNFIKIEEIEIPIYKLKVDFDIITFEEPICAHLIDIKRFTHSQTRKWKTEIIWSHGRGIIGRFRTLRIKFPWRAARN